jgi:hypothetical protein
MLSKFAVIATAATGALAQPITTTDQCTWGAPINGKYVYDVAGLTAEECQLHRVNVARGVMGQNIGTYIADIGKMSTSDMPVSSSWTSYADVTVGETCPASAGVGGAAGCTGKGCCSTWTTATANETHPAAFIDVVPAVNVMLQQCTDNSRMNKHLAAMNDNSINTKNPSTAVGNALMSGYYKFIDLYCEYFIQAPSVAAGGISCKMGEPSKALDFGKLDLMCCKSAHAVTSAKIHETGSSIASLKSKMEYCATTECEGGDMTSSPSMPSNTTLTAAKDFVLDSACECGLKIGQQLPSELKASMDADGDAILDMCTTTTTTTTTVGKSSDSGAAGLTASFSALVVAISATLF